MLLNLALLGNGDVNRGLQVATSAVGQAASGQGSARRSGREMFTASGATTDSSTASAWGTGVVVTYIVLYVLWSLISSFAAARLSWSYNMFLGNGTGWAFLYSIGAFLFSEIYFVLYAFLFNPVSGKGMNVRRNNGGANRTANF